MRPRRMFLSVLDPFELLAIDPVGVVDEARRIGHGDRLATQAGHVLDGVLRHVARSRYQAVLPYTLSWRVLSISSTKYTVP